MPCNVCRIRFVLVKLFSTRLLPLDSDVVLLREPLSVRHGRRVDLLTCSSENYYASMLVVPLLVAHLSIEMIRIQHGRLQSLGFLTCTSIVAHTDCLCIVDTY